MARSRGRASSPDERSKWTWEKLVQMFKMMIRWDLGGSKDPVGTIAKRVKDSNLLWRIRREEDSDNVARMIGEFVLEHMKDTAEGIRKRTRNHIDEIDFRHRSAQQSSSSQEEVLLLREENKRLKKQIEDVRSVVA